MKTKILNLTMIFAAVTALALTGCSSDDGGPDPVPEATCTDGIRNGNETGVDCGGSCPNACPSNQATLTGTITEDTTLDPAISYTLDGSLSVEAPATLTIPAGVVITANAASGEETETYIVVKKGARIDIQGTSGSPVIMTSNNENPGDWGGLILLGDATTTEGVDAIAEVGGFVYGGNNNADDSGSISYLVINYAGAQINAESQYNGLTLYAVGSGTTIDNVAMLNGTDDGVEFFGGTVSATNLYFENNEDDSIDWTEGWNGSVTNAYILHTIAGFSTVVEADGINGNPSITNLTAVSSEGGTALQFKKESGATISGLSLTGYVTSLDFPDGGAPANVQIEGVDADPDLTYLSEPTVDASNFAWVQSETTLETIPLTGSTTEDLTLDANFIYQLEGSFSVEEGATLTIPAGTVIIANADNGQETATYIVVKKGARINVQGTADDPVIMTSTNQNPGDWGGLILLGDATTTEGVDAIAEVGGFVYGGANDADDSGSINYLVINYAGAQINAESQYNGLTLYAVGSETTIENVAILNGTDDGVEFFGGTVSASNLYLENNEDDAVDWTEGWNGTLTNALVIHSIAGFSTAIEADGINANPSLVNFTAIATEPGIALQFKKESGATITNLYLSGYTTQVDMVDGGPISNVQIDGADAAADGDYTGGTQVDIASFAWATGA